MKSEIIVQPTGDTLTILEGKALDPKYPEKIKLSGNIESISSYLKKRYNDNKGKGLQEVDKEKAILIVDDDKMSIVMLLDAESPFGTSVTASLEHTKELKVFQINQNAEKSREEIIQLLKHSKRFFDDPMKHEEMLKSYMKLNLSGTTSVKKETDDRGNSDLAFKRNIDSQNIPVFFVLKMPIFKGQPEETFRVEVCLSVTDASVRFWFESVELTELIEKRWNEISEKELRFAQDFVIIHK